MNNRVIIEKLKEKWIEDFDDIKYTVKADGYFMAGFIKDLLQSIPTDPGESSPESVNELVEALEKIRDMKLLDGETTYQYAFNRNWHIAVDALSKLKEK